MKGLNIKGLCKQIKDSKRDIMWSLKDGVYTITNRHWMITMDKLPSEVSVALYAIFHEFPSEGENLQITVFNDVVMRHKALNTDGIYKTANEGFAAKNTGFILKNNNDPKRVFKSQNTFAYINEKYLLAIDIEEYTGDLLLSGPMSPLYYADINYIVLPYRITDNPEKEIIELFTK